MHRLPERRSLISVSELRQLIRTLRVNAGPTL
jgi:hypothetical protein